MYIDIHYYTLLYITIHYYALLYTTIPIDTYYIICYIIMRYYYTLSLHGATMRYDATWIYTYMAMAYGQAYA